MAIPPPLGPYPSGSAFSGVLPSTIGLPVAPFGLQEVYIQRVGDPSHFKPAPTSASLGRRRSVASGPTGGARARSEVVERGPWPRGLSACAVNACAVPEVLKLEKLGEEAEIFELCVGAERGRVLYRAVAGLLQGVLLGILLAALLVEIERPGSGGADGVASLRCFTLALTESCFTLNLLRAHDGYAHGLQGEEQAMLRAVCMSMWFITDEGMWHNELDDRDGSGSRRRAWELVAHAAVLAVMNAVGLLCCLLSEMLSDEEANEARADVRVEQEGQHRYVDVPGEGVLVVRSQEDFKKEAEHWRKDAAEQAVRVKSAEQRLQQPGPEGSSSAGFGLYDDQDALAEQLQAAVVPWVDQPVVKRGKPRSASITLVGTDWRRSEDILARAPFVLRACMGDGLMRWVTGGPLAFQHKVAPGRLKAAKAKSKGAAVNAKSESTARGHAKRVGDVAREDRVKMPAFKGNLWNMSACNRLVAERTELRRHERHLQALESTRGQVDARQPKEHTHLRSKLKTRKLQEDRAAEIQLENRILLQKMLNIDTKPSQLADAMSSSTSRPRSLHGESQRREAKRIAAENQALLQRLQNTKPSIDPRTWDEEEVDRQALKFRLSQNSAAGRVLKLRMPNKEGSGRLPRITDLAMRSSNDSEWERVVKPLTEMDPKEAL
ncbi:Sperm axonemal maintenance protein CFAP97D1 (CFAP97 domain-containing protein 1) [Durusdinium trenchii]|uniref:Sperm axonemal maintenance protein CFAP97D1 (CFAP97 domain-containing protein 1) n=1 Tax=Durusdinium trenchii TaxID=1381693 RepID=A0ABP0LW84_9DINO